MSNFLDIFYWYSAGYVFQKTMKIFIFFILLFQIACDHGLDPERDPVKPGFDGTVTLIDGWPENSEIRMVFVVVFQSIPEDSEDAVNQFFQGRIRYTELEPPFQSEYQYSIDLDPGIYELVVCIGVKGNQIFNLEDWTLCGVYTETNNPFEPSPIHVPEDDRLSNIDIQGSVTETLPIPF